MDAALNHTPPEGPFDLAVEEEYQLVDPHTWELRSTIHAILEKDLEDGVEDVRAEFLQSQMEAVTHICATVQELRSEVWRMRREADKLARSLGLGLAAAGTHPFSRWTEQQVTRGARYAALAEELQEVGRRLVTFGMHVHVGIADPDLRIQVMNRIRPYLPLLLALSTSSPFFNGRFTGLQSYRASVFASLPRTGIPPYFGSWEEYRTTVDHLLATGLLTDASFIWWDARPSARFPTLEVRIHDMPSRVEETICLAAWVQALAVKLARESEPAHLRRFITDINKWEAARHGLEARLLISPDGPRQRLGEWVETLLDWIDDVADELGSAQALAYTTTILQEGTSASRQLRTWRETDDLQAVVAQLAQETLEP